MNEKMFLKEAMGYLRKKIIKILTISIVMATIITGIAIINQEDSPIIWGVSSTYLITSEGNIQYEEDASDNLLSERTAVVEIFTSDIMYEKVISEAEVEITKEEYRESLVVEYDAEPYIYYLSVLHPDKEIAEKIKTIIDNNIGAELNKFLHKTVDVLSTVNSAENMAMKLEAEKLDDIQKVFEFNKEKKNLTETIIMAAGYFIFTFTVCMAIVYMVFIIKMLFESEIIERK